MDFALSSQLSSNEGRKLWLKWFEQCNAVAVVINPAGPLGFVAHAPDCRGARAPMFGRAHPTSENAWLDLGARAAERRRVAELHAALRTAEEEGDEQTVTALQPEIADQNRMGSMLWAAEMLILSGHWRLGRAATRLGVAQLLTAGVYLGRFADPYRAIDTLIDLGERLTALEAEGVDDPEQPGVVRTYLAEVAKALPLLTTGYRAEGIVPFARWRLDTSAGG